MDVPPEVSGHLDRFRDGLLALVDLRGLYLYGSLTTGDFSPASSDIDVLAVTGGKHDGAALARLADLHRDLARGGGAYARLNCLYVPDGTLTDAELLHTGCAVHGPWPPPGLPEVSIGEVQAHARRELTGYWRPLTYRPRIWLQDRWVDFALITLARSEALTHDGVLITKSQAIARLGDFGVPPSLADQIRRRRAGERVPVTTRQRLLRAARARQIMAAGIRDLTRS